MEASQSPAPTQNPNPNSNFPNISNSILSSTPVWPTIDGPLGLSEEESLSYARRFYKFGYALLPLLWAVNCFYFWPVLRHSRSFPRLRPYVVASAIGFSVFSVLLCSWVLTFAIGGEHLFGPTWDQLTNSSHCDFYVPVPVMLSSHHVSSSNQGEQCKPDTESQILPLLRRVEFEAISPCPLSNHNVLSKSSSLHATSLLMEYPHSQIYYTP
ncbi:hypothetical protein V6N13_126718 [Hibiscus sabdariffa]